MARTSPAEADEGKRVVDEHGNEIGVVSGVRAGKLYVDPDPGIADSVLATLGWENIDEDDYAVDRSDIDAIDDDEIRLKR